MAINSGPIICLYISVSPHSPAADKDKLPVDPESPADAHEMLCLHWPGSFVKLRATPDRADLDGKMAKICGADHRGCYQVLVVPTERKSSPPETVFIPADCVEHLPDNHPKSQIEGFPPSSFRGPSKLLRLQVGEWVRANTDNGWVIGQIGSMWNPNGSIYSIMVKAPEGPGYMTVSAPIDSRQYVRYGTRFQLGERVQCNTGEKWMEGQVIDFALEIGNMKIPYKVAVEDGVLNVPRDSNECIRPMPQSLRFSEGDSVRANMGERGWVKGVILTANTFHTGDTPVYEIQLDGDEEEVVTAPADNDCFVRSLDWKHSADRRFKVGDRVQANAQIWRDGVIGAVNLPDGRVYRVDLDDGKTYFALTDGEQFVRLPPRFKVGDRVQAFMGADVGWMDGTVKQLGSPDASWVYAIDLDIKGRFNIAHAPTDTDSIVRKINDIFAVVRGAVVRTIRLF